MRPALLFLALLSIGCDARSHLEPSEPLDALDEGETAQLCRFTTDVLSGVDEGCDPAAPASLQDFDACAADPPWDECVAPDGEPADVGSWEDCVNRLAEGFCEPRADERCWHLRCR